MADTATQAEVKTDYPVVSGLDSNQKHKGRQIDLKAERGSFISKRSRGIGIDG